MVRKKHKKNARQGSRDKGIFVIAVFKLFKVALLLAIAIGALSLLHDNVADAMMDLLAALHVDHNNHYIHGLIVKLGLVDDHKLELISAGSFFYAGLLATEGIGLLLRKHWAEYLTIIATASFIPLEIYELVKHFGIGKVIALIINVAVVVYLIYRVKYDPIHMQSHSR